MDIYLWISASLAGKGLNKFIPRAQKDTKQYALTCRKMRRGGVKMQWVSVKGWPRDAEWRWESVEGWLGDLRENLRALKSDGKALKEIVSI